MLITVCKDQYREISVVTKKPKIQKTLFSGFDKEFINKQGADVVKNFSPEKDTAHCIIGFHLMHN